MSRSPSRERGIRHKASRTHETLKAAKHCRRKSSRERSMSENSVSPYHKDPAKAPRNNDQDTRSRQQPYSPNDGGRERSSGRQMRNVTLGSSHKRRRSLSSSMSCTSGSSYGGRRRHGPVDNDRRTRPRRSSMSPDVRGRDRWSRAPRNSRKSRSRTNSMDRSRIARERRSMTPDRASRGDKDRRRRDGFGVAGGQSGYAKDNDRYGSSFRGKEHEHSTAPKPVSLPRKERSLSPFSKRLALTQAMNMGI